MAAVGFSLIVLVMMANLIAFEYARGVVRAAVDEGARAGSRSGAPAQGCEDRAHEVMASLLGGPMGEGITIQCRLVGSRVEATGKGVFRSWLPPVPDLPIQVVGLGVGGPGP